MDGGTERDTSGPHTSRGWRRKGGTGTLGLDKGALVTGAIWGFRSGSVSTGKRSVVWSASELVPLSGEPVAEGLPVVWASTLYLRAPICTLRMCEWAGHASSKGIRLGQLTGSHLSSSLQSTGRVEYDLPTGDFQQYLWVSCVVTAVVWESRYPTMPRKL